MRKTFKIISYKLSCHYSAIIFLFPHQHNALILYRDVLSRQSVISADDVPHAEKPTVCRYLSSVACVGQQIQNIQNLPEIFLGWSKHKRWKNSIIVDENELNEKDFYIKYIQQLYVWEEFKTKYQWAVHVHRNSNRGIKHFRVMFPSMAVLSSQCLCRHRPCAVDVAIIIIIIEAFII